MTSQGERLSPAKVVLLRAVQGTLKVSISRPIACEIKRYTYNECNVTDRMPEISSYTVIFGIVKSLRAWLAVFPGKPLKLPDQLV
jgi:hypothetical protein